MKYLLIIASCFILIACKGQTTETVTKIDIETLKKNAIDKDVQLVDVRTPEEYKQGHIDDAININISELEAFKTNISSLDKSQAIYIYCHKGGRSNKASEVLKAAGFTEIYDYSGGWSQWSAQ